MQDKTIIFRVYDTLPEAQYVKDALEQNGVECFLADQLWTQLYPLYGTPATGIRVMILDKDLEKAEDILKGLQEL